VQTDFIAHPLHGTGDVFASVLTGALVKGTPLTAAARQAAAFVRDCAVRTVAQGLPIREGVDFEPLLWQLTEQGGAQ
jgi:pyridoxine kinase